jgi:hypothetical protein
MKSFLDLPTELRNYIYGYMAMEIPISTPLTSYLGLYLSCHQIKSEIETECAPILRAQIAALQDSIKPVHLTIPSSFLPRQHLHVCQVRQLKYTSGTSTWFRRYSYDQLLLLCKLHITTLSIAAKGTDANGSHTIALLELVIARTLCEEVNVRRIVVHMPIMSHSGAEYLLHNVIRPSIGKYLFRWVLTPEGVKAVWEVEGKGGCGKQDKRVMRVLQGALTGSLDLSLPSDAWPIEHSFAAGD